MSVKIKAAVRERDGSRCTQCGMTAAEHVVKYGKNLDVHRIEPGSEYTIEGCFTVCRTCHGHLPKTLSPSQVRRLMVPYTTIHIQLPSELKTEFMIVAKQSGRTLAAELIRAMEKQISQWEKKRAEEQQGEDE